MADGRERCLAEMASRDLDALFLGRESNARFVSGATRLWLQGARAFAPTCIVVRSTGAVLPDVELADGEAALRAARRVKQPEEIDGIRAAVAMAEDAFGAALTALRR